MNEHEQPRRRRRRLYRTSADWFGLAAMGLLMICSLVLLVQLMSTKLLTDLYLILIEIVLLLINAGHVIIQLPIRRVKTSKVVCGLLAVILSGLMLYGSVAAASGKSALLAIAGKNLQKTTSYVVVMADDPARSIGDTVGYTFGILSQDADISADNTSALLEDIKDGLGGKVNGVPREDGFDITVASEVMAVLCLASDIPDLKARLGRMIVAYTYDGRPVTAHDLKAEGAMTALLKDALKPNLVQTLEHEAEAEVIEVVPCKAEPTVRSTVFAGLPKGERSDFLVQKCTEAGASEIVFFSCTRCVAKAVNMEKKLERWQRIAEEAAKQSGRGIIPQVRYEADFVAVLNGALHTDLPLFMYETGERETIRDAIEHTASPIASAAIITGPEGGFAEFEADMARKLGMHICSMGERILRCETAPVVALTALMYGTGNL